MRVQIPLPASNHTHCSPVSVQRKAEFRPFYWPFQRFPASPRRVIKPALDYVALPLDASNMSRLPRIARLAFSVL